MTWVAAGIAGGTALLKLGTGIVQNSSANSIDKNNPFPNKPVQGEYGQNLRQSEQMAQVGMPAQQYNNQLNSIQRNEAGALSSFARTGGGSEIASIVRQGNEATNKLNAEDAIARNRNMLNLLQQRQILAQQKDKAWDWNSQQKYLGLLAKSQAMKGAGYANINGAFNDLSSEATTLSNNGAFGKRSGSGSNVPPSNADVDFGDTNY